MPQKVYVIAPPLSGGQELSLPAHMPAQQRADELAAGLAAAGSDLLVEAIELEPEECAQALRDLLSPPEVLGAELHISLSGVAAAACSGLSSFALHSAAATAVVRRGQDEARLCARDILAKGFTSALLADGVRSVRTALVLGTGPAARSAMAALHEMGCNRFLIGFQDSERAAEIARQLRHWKRQLQFFPLQEMLDFILWANRGGVFQSEYVVEKATDREYKLRAERDDRQDPRRWELVVNATPVGNPGVEPDNLLPDLHFMGCLGRVLDMAGNGEPTPLMRLAMSAGLPVTGAGALAQALHAEALMLWQAEIARREQGLPDEAEEHAHPRKLVLKRREGYYRGGRQRI